MENTFNRNGKKTMTGGRLKRLKKYLNDETFMMTYGDGISNVNIKKLINFHKKAKKISHFDRCKTSSKIWRFKD